MFLREERGGSEHIQSNIVLTKRLKVEIVIDILTTFTFFHLKNEDCGGCYIY